ncbi:hypothetical protein EJD97_003692 [Solanum chilense]|uniref:Uncharacterized protein n=1 Tax=Solanum chilense TaxID=4083 RepID=A0A6N2BYP4_SOLCI|nr:hypothetical protein EJD97_003692 [Solanum chilense]
MDILVTGQPALAAGQKIYINSNSIPISNQDTGTKDNPDEHKSLPTAQGGKYVDLHIPNTANLSQNLNLLLLCLFRSRMNTIEHLQYAAIGKFFYGWPDMDDMRNSNSQSM